MSKQFASFAEFYPTYLAAHSKTGNRRLHFIGSLCVLGLLVTAIATGNWWWLLAGPVVGYGFAWTGHFGIEGNKPASFGHPLYSLLGDWVMFKDILTGKIRF